MRIVIDLQPCQIKEFNENRVSNYSLLLAKALAKYCGPHELKIVLNLLYPEAARNIEEHFVGLLSLSSFSYYSYPQDLSPKKYVNEIATVLIRNHYAQLQPDILHISNILGGGNDKNPALSLLPKLSGTINSVTLYDLNSLICKDKYLCNKKLRESFCEQICKFKSRDAILSISEASRRVAIEYLNISPNNIVSIYGGVDEYLDLAGTFKQNAKEFLGKFGIYKSFILYIDCGNQEVVLNNLTKVYSSSASTFKEKYQLVVVHLAPNATTRIVNIVNNYSKYRIIYIARVTNMDLIRLCNLCVLSIFSELGEAFGMPILQAMACGAPVLGVNNSSIKEIIDNEDALFECTDSREVSSVLRSVLNNSEFLASLRDYGLRRSKLFTWERSAKTVINFYEELYKQKNSTVFKPLSNKDGEANRIFYQNLLIQELVQIPAVREFRKKDLMKIGRCAVLNQLEYRLPRILCDVSYTIRLDHQTGIQRVVKELTPRLCELFHDRVSPEAVFLRDKNIYLVNNRPNVSLFSEGEQEFSVTDIRYHDILLLLDSSWDYYKNFLNVFAEVRKKVGRLYAVIYDIIPILYPEYFDIGLVAVFENWLRYMIKHTDGLICISKTVADDVVRHILNNNLAYRRELKIGFFHIGANFKLLDKYGVIRDKVRQCSKNLNQRATFLMVSTIEPRKGHAFVVKAFEKLWQGGINVAVCFVGKKGWKVDAFISELIDHPEYGKRLWWISDASDEEVVYCYQNATAVILASRMEGFGLPIVEAAQHDLPVICSDIPVFHEVGGENVTYFSLKSPDFLAETIVNWMRSVKKPDSSKIDWLTWEQSAQQLLKIIAENNWYMVLH